MQTLQQLVEQSPWLLVAFWFAVGGIIGSFLNVVIYRLPQGLSLVHPPSRCPACGRGIRWHDNVPVLGWLWLRGKCRDCGVKISPRYPLVELFVGLMFAAVAYVDLVAPQRVSGNSPDLGKSLLNLLVHTAVLCPLFAAAMIEHDGCRAKPRRSRIRPAAMGFVLVLLWFLFGQMLFA